MIIKKCLVCHKEFTGKKPWINTAKFCCRQCYWSTLINKKPWNYGTVGIMKPNKTSIKKGQRLSPQTEFKRKNKELGYHGLHDWVYKKLGRPLSCEQCGSIVGLEWANKSFKYLENISDWISLCRFCHKKRDYELGWGLATKKFPELRK